MTDRLINQDNRIEGAGRIGLNRMGIVNRGVIEAKGSNPLVVDPGAAGAINSGRMLALSGNNLWLGSGDFTNFEGSTSGTIVANGGTVTMNGATVTGGEVRVVGTGTLDLSGSTVTGGTVSNSAGGTIVASRFGSSLGGDVSNPSGGQVIVADGASLVLESGGSVQNAGVIRVESTGAFTTLGVSGGDVTLSGGGRVILSDSNNNFISGGVTDRLINQDNRIEGAGRIGLNRMGIVNRGVIEANGGNQLVVDPGDAQGFLNEGALLATGTGGAVIGAGGFETSGSVDVARQSSLDRYGAYLQTAGLTTVNGTLSATGIVDIQGGVLRGSGTIDASLTSLSIVEPGVDSPGTLTISGDYTQNPLGDLSIDIGGLLSGDEYDVLNVFGEANLAGTLSVSLFGGFNPAEGMSFDILAADTILGSFDALDLPVLSGGHSFTVRILSDINGTTTDVVRLTTTPVPVPPSVWLFVSGLGGLLSIGKKRRYGKKRVALNRRGVAS